MKITDLRISRTYEGEHICTIPGGSMPTDEQAKMYLGEEYRERTVHKRIVLKVDGRYMVFPINKKFFKVQP